MLEPDARPHSGRALRRCSRNIHSMANSVRKARR
jgi:hypothetical protein